MAPDEPSVNGTRADPDRVADALRERISSGQLRPGDSLPTQKALMEEFHVERGAVRQALDQLKQENLLADVTRGAPPTIARPSETDSNGPRSAGMELADRLSAAFKSKHVTLDAFSLTTETLRSALDATRIVILGTTRTPPESVRIRILLPAPDTRLAVPRLVADPEDERPLDRLRTLTQNVLPQLRHSAYTLAGHHHTDIKLEIRSVAFTPSHKLYLLNGTEALMAYYPVVESEVLDNQGKPMVIYDVEGLTTKLFRFTAGRKASASPGAAFVAESQNWFNSLWDTIAVPYGEDPP